MHIALIHLAWVCSNCSAGVWGCFLNSLVCTDFFGLHSSSAHGLFHDDPATAPRAPPLRPNKPTYGLGTTTAACQRRPRALHGQNPNNTRAAAAEMAGRPPRAHRQVRHVRLLPGAGRPGRDGAARAVGGLAGAGGGERGVPHGRAAGARGSPDRLGGDGQFRTCCLLSHGRTKGRRFMEADGVRARSNTSTT